MLTAQDYHWRPPGLLCSCKHVQASLKKHNKARLRSVWAPSPRGDVGPLIPAVTSLSIYHSFATVALWGTCTVELDSTSDTPTGTLKGNQFSKLLIRRQGTRGILTEEVDVESTWGKWTPMDPEEENLVLERKKTRFDIDPPSRPLTPAMPYLTLELGPAKTKRTWTATIPTWGQIKKLSQEAESLVHHHGLPKTSANLLLAMVTLITVSVSVQADSSHYWAYIPNPHLLRPIT